MTILPMTNPDELGAVAQRILEKALENSETRALIDQLLEDPEAGNKRKLFGTAFCMGAASALGEMMKGHVVQVDNEPRAGYGDS